MQQLPKSASAGTAMEIAGNALAIMFARAVGHGATGSALWIGYGAEHWLSVLIAIPLAIFLLGVGMGARATGKFGRWLAGSSIVLSVLLVGGAGTVLGGGSVGGQRGSGFASSAVRPAADASRCAYAGRCSTRRTSVSGRTPS